MTKILIIEDDSLIRELVENILRQAGYVPIVAKDGLEGIARFKAEAPALVITDIIMPEKEGIETIIEIRRLSREVKIIAISGGGWGGGGSEFLEMAEKLGASAALAKPFRPAELVDTVARLLQA